jgi:hypothetical protein
MGLARQLREPDMKTIHKFRLTSDRQPNILTLREGYRVVRCEYVVLSKAVFLWVEQPLSVGIPTVECTFQVAYSGDPLPAHFEYVDTALDPFAPEAYHVFDISPAQEKASATLPRRANAHSSLFIDPHAYRQGAV